MVWLGYDVAADPDSPVARCVFLYGDPLSGDYSYQTAPIIIHQSEDKKVVCFSPRAEFISDEIMIDGGLVRVYLSTNGMDFSSNYANFLYLPLPIITSVRPIFLLSDADQTVYIDGHNFFEPTTENIIQIARVTSL